MLLHVVLYSIFEWWIATQFTYFPVCAGVCVVNSSTNFKIRFIFESNCICILYVGSKSDSSVCVWDVLENTLPEVYLEHWITNFAKHIFINSIYNKWWKSIDSVHCYVFHFSRKSSFSMLISACFSLVKNSHVMHNLFSYFLMQYWILNKQNIPFWSLLFECDFSSNFGFGFCSTTWTYLSDH